MLRVLLLLCLATGSPALAAETGVVLIDGTSPPESDRRGEWVEAPGGVRLAASAPGHLDVLLPEGPRLRDGRVVARVKLGPQPDLTVLVRAHTDDVPGGDLEGTSAVGLTLDRKGMRWDRWDRGVTLPLAPRRAISGLAGRTVEVELVLADTRLVATVRTLDGAALGRLSVVDTGSGTGRVGVRAGGDTTSVVQQLRASGEAIPAGEGPRADPDAPLGEQRFVLVTESELAALPPAVRHQDLGVWPYDDRGLHGILTDPATLWSLQEQGLAITEVRPLVPFWALDADLRTAARSVPIGPDGPDLTASYKDPEMVEVVLRDWAARYPHIASLHTLGTSRRGRPILALRITDADDPPEPAVLITGATHGSELLSTEYALDAAQGLLRGYGADAAVTRRVDALDTWVVPLLNPDGNDVVHRITRFGGRKNGADTVPNGRPDPWEGVDLNRNFPLAWGRDEVASRGFPSSAYYRGPAPASEPETLAVQRLADTHRFVAAVSFHTNGSMILVPYTIDGVPSPTPNTAWAVAEQVAAEVPRQPSGKELRVRRQLYPVDGTDQDWLRHTYGTVAFIVEGSHHNPTTRSIRFASVAALRPLVPTLLDRVIDGPRVSGRVVDAAGDPVEAVVSVDAEAWAAGETWGSRPADGRFERLLPRPGPVTLTATAAGYAPASLTVDPAASPDVEIVLTPLP